MVDDRLPGFSRIGYAFANVKEKIVYNNIESALK